MGIPFRSLLLFAFINFFRSVNKPDEKQKDLLFVAID